MATRRNRIVIPLLIALATPVALASQLEALSTWSIFHKKKGFSEADKAAFKFLNSIGDPVLILENQTWEQTKRIAWSAKPGAIIVLKGKFEVWTYFREHGYELLPFRWRDYWIVRKRCLVTSA